MDTSEKSNVYNMTEVPAGIVQLDPKVLERVRQEQPDAILWTGTGTFETPPPIGARVNVRMNGFGLSTVTGYFVEHKFLGLQVKPDVRPKWHQEQQPGRRVICVFGTEIQPL